ncbi:RNA-directed DNA polymerase, eukaryota, reverse transcriptase zinc-binding domain protein [Tanacetum coccineum]
MVGWNDNLIDLMVVHSCKQSILCIIETIPKKVKLFCSIIYASNYGMERRELWKDLQVHKWIANTTYWVVMDDFNVTLKPNEHSNGFHFAWIKSLKNPHNSSLKKLDRILVSEDVMKQFVKAHGLFLPYIVFDHSSSILIIPEGLTKKHKSFRFANYVADKK